MKKQFKNEVGMFWKISCNATEGGKKESSCYKNKVRVSEMGRLMSKYYEEKVAMFRESNLSRRIKLSFYRVGNLKEKKKSCEHTGSNFLLREGNFNTRIKI